eukprot:s2412_g15.t1
MILYQHARFRYSVRCDKVRAEAKRNVEAEAEICRHELQSARLAQDKQRQLEQQLHQGRQLSSFLEQEASRLKEEVRVRDEHWQALFRHYPAVGHAFFSSAATADDLLRSWGHGRIQRLQEIKGQAAYLMQDVHLQLELGKRGFALFSQRGDEGDLRPPRR